MNPPTIAVLVPGIKSHANASSGPDTGAPEQNFSSVLADKVAEGSRAQEPMQQNPAVGQLTDRSGQEAGLHETADLPLTSEPTGQVDTEAQTALEEHLTDLSSEARSALPAIILDIASHLPDQLKDATRAAATAKSATPVAESVGMSGSKWSVSAAAAKMGDPVHVANSSASDAFTQLNRSQMANSRTQSLPASIHATAGPDARFASTVANDSRNAPALMSAQQATPAALADALRTELGVKPDAQTVSGSERSAAAGLTSLDTPPNAPLAALNTPGVLPTSGAVLSAAIATPVHQSGWDADFSRQVVMLARDTHTGTQTAELRLDPPELGPLRISLSLSEGMASALFVSAHASVRQAIEAALPQLSQQLAQAGISLGDTQVGDHGQAGFAFNDDSNNSSRQGANPNASQNSLAAHETAQPIRRAIATTHLVDTFA